MHITGDSPELVENVGMKNLVNSVKDSLGFRIGKILFGFVGIVIYL